MTNRQSGPGRPIKLAFEEASARVIRYLAQHHADILAEFQKLSDLQKAA